MTAPSPVHRDPDDEEDSGDYGCFTAKANRQVVDLVEQTITKLEAADFDSFNEVKEFVHGRLREIGRGATDTVVKENVFHALADSLTAAEIHYDWLDIYG